jgi:hypothetical protein
MATWTEVHEHLRKHLTLAVDQPEWVGLNWRFKGGKADEEDVVQRQRIELAQANGEPAILVLCDIVEQARLPMEQMLARNMTLGVGCIALLDGGYVMRHLQPLAQLDMSTLEKTLTFLAHEAARLRETAPPAAT